jgi:hypothetical protein
MPTKRERIREKAIEIIEASPNGVRYSDLVRKLHEIFPEFPINTIFGSLWDFRADLPKEIYQPARGVYRHIKFKKEEITEEERESTPEIGIKEEDFYKPFANWLVDELEECTQAIPLGGNRFKDKWGTPDVIGKREPLRSDIVKAPTEIVSAEIKADTKDLITAFGQACAYKLFSHKSYIVVPKNSSQDDISKLDALCLIFGIGLVLFDRENINEPRFEIRVRPSKHEPDMFFVNKYMKLIENELFGS